MNFWKSKILIEKNSSRLYFGVTSPGCVVGANPCVRPRVSRSKLKQIHPCDTSRLCRWVVHLALLCLINYSSCNIAQAGQALESKISRDADLASEAFARCQRYLDAWSRQLDPATGLLQQSLGQNGNVWTPENSAADNFPFMVIAARFTKPETAKTLFSRAMVGEKLNAVAGWGLPTAFDLDKKEKIDREISRLIFGASEYAKDGLVPMVEILGPGPWSERMEELIESIFSAAGVETAFGALPSVDAEVNGEMLQVLCRLYWMTGREKYLDRARRIGDAYCFEVLPGNFGVPAHLWDFEAQQGDGKLKLRDHGCEIVSGLSLLYAIEKEKKSFREVSYYRAVKRMLDRIGEIAADESGLLFNEVNAATGEITRKGFSDCWGYDYYAWYTFYLATGEEKYVDQVKHVLANIHRFKDYPWEPRSEGTQSQDGIADAVEGALGLLSHLPDESAFEWVEHEVKRMFAFQQEDGIIEGWWGDGNFCRTALMYAFYKTKGTWCEPWREDLKFAAEQDGERLQVYLRSDKPWSGRLHFDPPRHRHYLKMSTDYPRINAFPEWYTVEPLEVYVVEGLEKEPIMVLGEQLISGLAVELKAGQPLKFNIRPVKR